MEVSFKIHVEQLGESLFKAFCPELPDAPAELDNTEAGAAMAFAASEAMTAALAASLKYLGSVN